MISDERPRNDLLAHYPDLLEVYEGSYPSLMLLSHRVTVEPTWIGDTKRYRKRQDFGQLLQIYLLSDIADDPVARQIHRAVYRVLKRKGKLR